MTGLSENTTDPKPFRPVCFLGNGYFSFVYSVKSQHEHDRDNPYSLKRFFLRKPEVLLLAQKEYKVLELLALDPDKSPFLPTLYYSFTIDVSPTFVLNSEMDMTLGDIVTVHGGLKVKHARFYLNEVICAVKYLHEKEIVHMKLKPNNVLLTKSGHIQLVDFDRSYNLCENRGKRPTFIDFSVAYYFAAPEIAGKKVITKKADIWTLGVLMAYLMGRDIRRGRRKNFQHLAKAGYWSIKRFSKLEKNLRHFFKAVFTFSYSQRPSILEVQKLAFFHDVNWEVVQALAIKPPFSPSELETFSYRLWRDPNHNHPFILNAIYDKCMPKMQKCRFVYAKVESGSNVVTIAPATSKFGRIGYTPEDAITALKQFNFIHPYLSYKRGLIEGKFTDEYIDNSNSWQI
ncbi:hypothetical protein ACTXT7_000639, partial [Hymenolepis weldensis]